MVEAENLSVRDLIVYRLLTNSQFSKRDDGYKLGLIPESGGMAGVISGWMSAALESYGAFRVFDSIYSLSAGTGAAIYFVSGAANLGARLYTEELTRGFISFRDLLRRAPMMKISYLLQAMRDTKPLDYKRAIDCPIPNHIYVTSALEPEIIDFSKFNHQDKLEEAIRLTMSIPIISGSPEKIGNRFYTDGGCLIGRAPLLQAIEDGCTHILVLGTAPKDDPVKISIKRSILEEVFMLNPLRRRDFGNLADRLKGRRKLIQKTDEMITKQENDVSSLPRIERIAINGPKIGELETRSSVLVAGAVRAFIAVEEYFKDYNLTRGDFVHPRDRYKDLLKGNL